MHSLLTLDFLFAHYSSDGAGSKFFCYELGQQFGLCHRLIPRGTQGNLKYHEICDLECKLVSRSLNDLVPKVMAFSITALAQCPVCGRQALHNIE